VPYGNADFHHCGRNGNDDIMSWTDRWEVQNCELVDLSDLATETSYVRGKLVAYLNDLISLGVDGFRVDAAKHMPVADLQAIYAQLTGSPYIYQEVIEGGTGEISPTEYVGIGDVTEFRYGDVVGNAFRDANLSNLNNLAGSMLLRSGDAVAFVDNHDTQRNGRARLTYKDGQHVRLGRGVHARLALRDARGDVQLHLLQQRRRPAGRVQRHHQRGHLWQRLGVRAPLAHHGQPGRAAQRRQRHRGHQLVEQRLQPDRVRPGERGLRRLQPLHLRAEPHLQHLAAGRDLLRRGQR
jgi:hypothetical protein